MIRINYSGGIPLHHQTSNEYQLPGITGAIQWNGTSRCFEVSTGSGWQKIDNNITLDTTAEVTGILQWAKVKMKEEAELKKLAESNATIKDLLSTIKNAQQQIKVVQTLIKDEVKV